MKLEKSNETCWSIKRKNNPGTFSLRFTESGGEIIKVTISLNDTIHETKFEMKLSEFENFFGIISSFKDLIKPSESQKHLKELNSEETYSKYNKISENQPSNQKISSDAFNFEKIVADIDNIDLKKSNLSKVVDNLTTDRVKEKEESKKSQLKETDWDPW
ncbi:hypothetical protein DSAG12_00767 [Promethearchaeum syntrophicum]|uniref:Uncharacterized protein n=1 Tax=Promethearchaeum syntrophicum TaxID=2594042 RepID=A0A5B9D735_9ARCH|nr:hypothetical protein [Candidatus Prometheoarchaeum syntrophicum]QEE14944.1 hypothetical protein DSAG12_00767 [Candidatus Prometheoarchaeum syntrophicum]